MPSLWPSDPGDGAPSLLSLEVSRSPDISYFPNTKATLFSDCHGLYFTLQVCLAGVRPGPWWQEWRQSPGHAASGGHGDRTAGRRGGAIQRGPNFSGHSGRQLA